jgi:hypothetical protein
VLRSVKHNEFVTDDTYQFNASAKAFLDTLAEIERNSKRFVQELAGMAGDHGVAHKPKVPAAQLAERKDAIVECLATLLHRGKMPWALSTVKNYFKQVLDR